MKTGLKLFLSLFLLTSSMVAFAASYVDGIEYFKAGQLDRAKILLERTLNDAGTKQAESYYYLGEIAFAEKNYKAAAEYYQKGLSIDPFYAYNKVGEGKLALQNKDEKGADKLFKEALKLVKKDAGVNLAIAKAYYETATPGYEKYLEKAYKINKQYPDYFVFKGDVVVDQKSGNYAGDAAALYENAIYFDENCIEAYVKYSHIYFGINPTLAIQMLERLQELKPESALAQREMAEAYYKNEQYTKAARAYETYIQNPNHFETDRPRLATLLFYGKRYNESLNLAKEILANDPNNFVLRRVLMYNNYEMANQAAAEKNKEAAEKHLAAAESAANDFLTMEPGANQYIVRDYTTFGELLVKQKKYTEAIAQYENAYDMDPTRHDLLKVLSDVHERNKDFVNALLLFKKFMAADPENNETTMNYYNLGQIYYSAAQASQDSIPLRDQYIQEADSSFQLVIEKAPTDFRGYLWSARANSLKDPELKDGAAQPMYEQLIAVLDQDPANKEKPAAKRAYIEAYKYLGYLNYLQTTNPAKQKEALANTKLYWNKMLELEPGNAEILEALETLK